ncbi:hypothetical protein D3C81_2111440 [compost metagenome]
MFGRPGEAVSMEAPSSSSATMPPLSEPSQPPEARPAGPSPPTGVLPVAAEAKGLSWPPLPGLMNTAKNADTTAASSSASV